MMLVYHEFVLANNTLMGLSGQLSEVFTGPLRRWRSEIKEGHVTLYTIYIYIYNKRKS